MINLSNYSELKTKGLISIARVGDAFAVSSKRFDTNTGEEAPSEVQAIDIKELQDKKAELLEAIKNIDQIIQDCKTL